MWVVVSGESLDLFSGTLRDLEDQGFITEPQVLSLDDTILEKTQSKKLAFFCLVSLIWFFEFVTFLLKSRDEELIVWRIDELAKSDLCQR